MALLNVDKLSVHFGDESAPFRAVDRISYSVKQGEVVGIVGESGSGKSVSSLAIMGLIDYPGRVMAEKLEFNGQDLQRISEKERRNLVGAEVAMIFQDPMTSLNRATPWVSRSWKRLRCIRAVIRALAVSGRLTC